MEVITPAGLTEAVKYMNQHLGTKVLAGGTDLLVKWKEGKVKLDRVLNVQGLQELRYIREENGYLLIGALNTHGEIAAARVVQEHAPVLAEACARWAQPDTQSGNPGG
ncbi:hypothetical protein N752_25440 [Desulforamulus aquiferis]|nr:FAD binding domain-containing protein [Desulforamulus aquiferis]RYD02299.1 hypothetical protein N752_25440 [Desulforamulus aquiferis]